MSPLPFALPPTSHDGVWASSLLNRFLARAVGLHDFPSNPQSPKRAAEQGEMMVLSSFRKKEPAGECACLCVPRELRAQGSDASSRWPATAPATALLCTHSRVRIGADGVPWPWPCAALLRAAVFAESSTSFASSRRFTSFHARSEASTAPADSPSSVLYAPEALSASPSTGACRSTIRVRRPPRHGSKRSGGNGRNAFAGLARRSAQCALVARH